MSDFKIVASVNEIQLSPEWKDVQRYDWKNLQVRDLVDAKGKKISRHYFGREYQLVAIKERQYSKAERLLRGFLGVIAVVAFLGLTLFFKPVRDLFFRKSETLYFGVAFESNLNPHETNLYNRARRLLIDHPQIKYPVLKVPSNIKNVSKVYQQLEDENLMTGVAYNCQVEDLTISEGYYRPNKRELTKSVKALIPSFFKKHQREILRTVDILENPEFKNSIAFIFETQNELVIFIQAMAMASLLKHLTIEQWHQILTEYKRLHTPQQNIERLKPVIENCKNFIESTKYKESKMMIWLRNVEIAFSREQNIQFRKIIQLRDLLFLNQPLRTRGKYF